MRGIGEVARLSGLTVSALRFYDAAGALVPAGVEASGCRRYTDEQVRAAEREWAAGAEDHVAVNREFLQQALDAGGAGQLVLELDGPIKPLRVPGDDSRFSILMPVRHEADAIP